MAWEDRGSGEPFYYRKERGADGRVQSRYVGQGPLAICVAEVDALVRDLARYRDAAIHRAEATLDGAGDAVESLTTSVRSRLDASMVAAGYRYHRGEWRRPRGGSEVREETEQLEGGVECPRVTEPSMTKPAATAAKPTATMAAAEPSEPASADSSEESSEWPEWMRRALPYGDPLAAMLDLASEARVTRDQIRNLLSVGEGDRTHPAYRAYAAAAGALADGWGDRGTIPTGDAVYEMDYLERRRLRGRIALGQASASGPHRGTAAEAALAVAAVLDEVGVDGRAAIVAAVRSSRRSLRWDSASALGRAVIDQYALARAHADLVAAFEAVAARGRSAWTKGDGSPLADCVDALAGAHGPLAETLRSMVRTDARPGATGEAAWQRRSRRARRRVADAERLVRHARKAGLVPTSDGIGSGPSSMETPPASGWPNDDPVVVLSAPAPLEPLQGEAAEAAERIARHIEALRAAWPPPARIRGSDMRSAGGLWSAFDYSVDIEDEEDPWWVLSGEPATPDEAAAELATWAPEYVPL